MPVIQVDNLGQVGIIRDVPDYELPINAFSGGANVRLEDGGIQRSLGHSQVYSTPSVALFHLMPWQSDPNYYWFGAGSAKIKIYDPSSESDATRASGDYSGGSHPIWTGGVFNGIPVLNHNALAASDYPQSWDTGSSLFVDMPNWPASSPDWLCKTIRPFREYMVAMYMQEDAGTYPTRLRWSAPADPGSLPAAWIPAATNLAGSKTFSDSTSPLVDCMPMRDVNVVYKEGSVHLMQYVGGVFVFNFRRAFSEFGLLSIRGVMSFYGKHLVLSAGDVVLHDGQQADSVATKKIRRAMFNAMSADYYQNSYLVAYPDRKEIWCCVPVNGSGTPAPTYAYIWNWEVNAWTEKELPQAPHVALGIVDESGLGTTFDDLVDGAGGGTFDDWVGPFDARTYNPASLNLLGIDNANSELVKFDRTNNAKTAYVERTGLALNGLQGGTITVDPHTIKFVRRVYPKMTADPGCVVTFKIGGQQYPGGPIDWTSYTFDPNSQTYISVAKQAKLLCYYIGSSTAFQWKLHSIGFDLDVIGWQ